MVEMQPVDSSFISAIGYDENAQRVTVEMKNGSVYDYPCSPDTYKAFLGSSSKGRFFGQHFK